VLPGWVPALSCTASRATSVFGTVHPYAIGWRNSSCANLRRHKLQSASWRLARRWMLITRRSLLVDFAPMSGGHSGWLSACHRASMETGQTDPFARALQSNTVRLHIASPLTMAVSNELNQPQPACAQYGLGSGPCVELAHDRADVSLDRTDRNIQVARNRLVA
jgi:hypothetical protein